MKFKIRKHPLSSVRVDIVLRLLVQGYVVVDICTGGMHVCRPQYGGICSIQQLSGESKAGTAAYIDSISVQMINWCASEIQNQITHSLVQG